MAETDSEDPLAHGVEGLKKKAQAEDPQLVTVRIVWAAADDETVVLAELAGIGELTVDDAEHVPPIPFVSDREIER